MQESLRNEVGEKSTTTSLAQYDKSPTKGPLMTIALGERSEPAHEQLHLLVSIVTGERANRLTKIPFLSRIFIFGRRIFGRFLEFQKNLHHQLRPNLHFLAPTEKAYDFLKRPTIFSVPDRKASF